jgi:hypothetical protein
MSDILMKPILKRLVNVFNIFTYTYIQALALSLYGVLMVNIELMWRGLETGEK